MKNMLLSVIVITMTAMLTGCWDFERLRDRMIITGLAIAEHEEGYRIGIEYLAFSGGSTSQQEGSAGQQTKVAQEEIVHPSIEIPLHFVQTKIIGDPFYANLHILVIGREQAKKGIDNIISHFLRDPDMRRTTQVIVSAGDPIELLMMQEVGNSFVSKYLESMIEHTEHSGRVITSDIGDISRSIHEGKVFFVPLVEEKGNKKNSEVTGTAVFKEGKYIDSLSHDESLLVAVLSRSIDHASLYMSCPKTAKGSVALDVIKNKPDLKPKIEGDKLIINGMVELEAYLSEYTCGDGKVKNKIPLKSLEKEFEEEFLELIQKRVPVMLHRTQSDLLELSSKLEKENPEQWKKIGDSFESYLKNANIHPSVNFEIKLKGTET